MATKKKSSVKKRSRSSKTRHCRSGYVKSKSTGRCVFATGRSGRKLSKKRASKKLSHHRQGRPSPNVSAKDFRVGTVRRGLDRKQWVVRAAGKSQRWVKL